MTLGKLILETASGERKQREVTPQELREIWESIAAWQSIDTAPKDGSHIIVADLTPGSTGFGWFDGKNVPFQAVAHYWSVPGEEGFYLSSGTYDEPLMRLTHWLPLPATRS